MTTFPDLSLRLHATPASQKGSQPAQPATSDFAELLSSSQPQSAGTSARPDTSAESMPSSTLQAPFSSLQAAQGPDTQQPHHHHGGEPQEDSDGNDVEHHDPLAVVEQTIGAPLLPLWSAKAGGLTENTPQTVTSVEWEPTGVSSEVAYGQTQPTVDPGPHHGPPSLVSSQVRAFQPPASVNVLGTSVNHGDTAGHEAQITPSYDRPPWALSQPQPLEEPSNGGSPPEFLSKPVSSALESARVLWGVQSSPPTQRASLPSSEVHEKVWSVWNRRLAQEQTTSVAPPKEVGDAAKPNTGQSDAPPFALWAHKQAGGELSDNTHGEPEGEAHGGWASGQNVSVSYDEVQKFETASLTADVMVASAPEATSSTPVSLRARALATAVREVMPQLTRMETATVSEARVELRVGDETVVVQVRIKDGTVDVDISGVTRAELDRIRDELQSHLPRAGLHMGDLRQGRENRRGWEPPEHEGWLRLEDEEQASQDAEDAGREGMPVVRHGKLWIKA
ncbi:MAG: hypothetical protein AAFX99_02950 [Myxococcota bacterium]